MEVENGMNIAEAKKAIEDFEYPILKYQVRRLFEALEKSVRGELARYSELESTGYQSVAAETLRKVLGDKK